MRTSVVFALLATSLPLAAATAAEPSARIGAEQSSFMTGESPRYYRGDGDVLYVNDRAGRWYWVQLNDGCLSATQSIRSLNFGVRTWEQRVDRFTQVRIEGTDQKRVNCAINSIRRIEFS